MFEVSGFLAIFLLNLALAGWAVAVMTWRHAERVLRQVLADLPTEPMVGTGPSEVLEVEDIDLDAADDGRSVELRARLRRSIEEIEIALNQTSEKSTQTSAQLMALLEKLGDVVAGVGRLAGEGSLPPQFKEQADALTEMLREVDPILGDAQENMDVIEAGLDTIRAEVARYGAASQFEWSSLRPSSAGLNRVLRRKQDGAGHTKEGEDTSIPHALAQAIDEALI
jgi:uncharacterized coiled-coil protein SlyX